MALLTTFNIPAFASYAATGQPCQLSPEPTKPEILAICTGDITITLIGTRPNKVRAIIFSNPTTGKPDQTLKLTATPLIDPETVSIMLVDFNFDGHKDFAITPRVSTSDNVQYRFFLYNPHSKKFQARPELSTIVNPEVNRQQKHIRSYWRKTPTLSGWDFWQWKNDKPFIAKRIEQQHDGNGTCIQTSIIFTGKQPARSHPQVCS